MSEYGCSMCHDIGFVIDRSNGRAAFTEISHGKYSTVRIQCPGCRPEPVTFGLPERLREVSFDTFDLKLNPTMRDAKFVCEAVARGEKDCALLLGSPGLGKSHLAAAALNQRGGAFWTSSALLLNIRRLAFGDDGPHYDEELVVATWQKYRELLVIDDLGVEKASEFAGKTYYDILDARHQARLPTIITGNDPSRIDERILSRFAGGLVDCRGRDVRYLGTGA